MKIYCVCGFGLGSSMIARANVEELCEKLGIEAEIETCDLGSIAGINGDMFVTTREIAEEFPEELKPKTVILTNFVKKSEIESTLKPYLLKLDNQEN